MAVWGYFYFQEVTCLKAPLYCWLSNWMLVDVFLTCIELTMTILLFLSFSLFLVLFRPFKSRRQRWRRAEKKGWDQKTKAKTDIRTSFPVRASTSKVHWYSLLSFTHLLYIFSSIYILCLIHPLISLSHPFISTLILPSLHSSYSPPSWWDQGYSVIWRPQYHWLRLHQCQLCDSKYMLCHLVVSTSNDKPLLWIHNRSKHEYVLINMIRDYNCNGLCLHVDNIWHILLYFSISL